MRELAYHLDWSPSTVSRVESGYIGLPGFHPLCAFVDHGAEGTGEPLSILLRPGNAGSNTAADHISVARDALRQLPFTGKGGRIGRCPMTRCSASPKSPTRRGPRPTTTSAHPATAPANLALTAHQRLTTLPAPT